MSNAELRELILKTIKNYNPAIVESPDEDLLEAMILDSFDFVNLAADLEEALGIEIDNELVVHGNFRNLPSIIALVEEIFDNKHFQEVTMERVLEFLQQAEVYYLATVEGDQPRVRPFGTQLIYEGKLYIQTGKSKDVSKQLSANPKAEICAFKDGKWLRVSGEFVNDDRVEVKKAMLDAFPSLRGMYDENDDNTQVLYIKNATATFSSFTSAPEEITF